MTRPFSRGRRFAVAGAAFAIALLLFRTQVAESLVVRGDDLFYRGQSIAALEHYERALFLDPALPSGADRVFFVSIQERSPEVRAQAAAAVARALRRHPEDPALLADRALYEVMRRHYADAERDYAAAGAAAGNSQDLAFARWAARHARNRAGALR